LLLTQGILFVGIKLSTTVPAIKINIQAFMVFFDCYCLEATSQLYNVFKHAKLYKFVDTETTKIMYARNLVPNVQK
jgi:hypothetical protein